MKKTIRTGASITKGEYWGIQYLTTVQKLDQNELTKEAIEAAITDINNTTKVVEKPPTVPKKKAYRYYYNIPKELMDRIMYLKINKDMYNWSNIDFVRYGLRKTFATYSIKFPEVYRIVRRYENENTETDA